MAFVDCEVLHYHPQKIVHLNNLKKKNKKKVVKNCQLISIQFLKLDCEFKAWALEHIIFYFLI